MKHVTLLAALAAGTGAVASDEAWLGDQIQASRQAAAIYRDSEAAVADGFEPFRPPVRPERSPRRNGRTGR